jgi:hypothetical protein
MHIMLECDHDKPLILLANHLSRIEEEKTGKLPHGRFDLDLNSRIDFGRLAA